MKALIQQAFKYFLLGVLAVIPIVLIIQIVLFIKNMVTRLFFSIYGYSESYLFVFTVLSISIAMLIYIGYSLVKHKESIIISLFDFIIEKIPFLNTIYRMSKKIINMFTEEDARKKREVVYLEYPKEGLWVPAYVTNRDRDMYVLYVPTSPNPTSGFTLIVHESKLVKSSMSIEAATSFIVSIGADFHMPGELYNKLAK